MANAEPRQERKVVTVLFADLVGFTSRAEQMDPEDVAGLLGPYHGRVRAELERFGGTVEKFIGDAVMALFGAPAAHEDDPERAVRAALAIRDWVAEEEDLQVRLAVNTGEALVTLGGGEPTAAGDVVNTAARLQQAAPVNGILVGEATYRATRHAIEYRDAEAVEAKGKSAPVTVWEALQARARFGVDLAQAPQASLVGREREVALLRAALDRVRAEREPQLVTLVGVPGIGKSRLVSELFRIVEDDPELIYWRQGRSLPYGEGVAFWSLGEMVKAQAGILDNDSAEAAAPKLRRAAEDAVGEEADWVERHLRPLAGLAGEAEAGEERRTEAFAAWRRFLEGLAEQRPLVLVFEDLQWADEGLLDFVDHLVDWASGVPILVVCTARPELLERRAGWGGGKLNATTLALSPLADKEAARLVASLLGRPVLAAETQEAMLDRAGGNPLYAEQFARMLLERGSAEDLPLPETVQGIIAARLDALVAEEKALLQDAAVVGKVFWPGALAALGGSDEASDELLHSLERKEFVRRERRSSVGGETEYAFRHVLVRDVAYGQIPRASRAERHRLAAKWIESLGRPEDHAEMLAHHYLAAIELARAAGKETAELAEHARLALRDAGDRAQALNAFGAAARFYGLALELWPREDRQRAELVLRCGKAHVHAEWAGDELVSEALDGLLAAGDYESAAEAEAYLALLEGRRGRRDPAWEHLERAVALVEHAPPSQAKCFVVSTLARQLMIANESEEAIRVARKALEIAESLELKELSAAMLITIGDARVELGDLDGLADFERGLALAVELSSPESIRGYINLADTMAELGDLERCSQLRAEGLRAAERFGSAPLVRWLRFERISELYWAGRWTEALRLADEFLAEVGAGSPRYLEGPARIQRGTIFSARGETERAAEEAVMGLELARAAKDPQALYPALAFSARALASAGRLREASVLADELLEHLRELGRIPMASRRFWAVDLAVVLDALGRGLELLEVSARVKNPTRWLEAAKAFASGDFACAADVFGEIGSRPDEAFARLRAAKALIASGRRAEAEAELDRALAFYREVGATAYIREGEALLAASA